MSERDSERGSRASSGRPAGGSGRKSSERPEGGERLTRAQRAARAARRRAAREAGEAPRGPRTGAKRTVMGMLREIPAYLRLLGGLLVDRRVKRLDKILVAGAIAYIMMPLDWVPDFIPFFGQVDDVFLLATSLRRLIENAGQRVLQDHWTGEPGELSELNLERVIASAAFFLPRGVRRRLRVIGRNA